MHCLLKAVDQDPSSPSSHRIMLSTKLLYRFTKMVRWQCTVVLSLRAHGVGISAMA